MGSFAREMLWPLASSILFTGPPFPVKLLDAAQLPLETTLVEAVDQVLIAMSCRALKTWRTIQSLRSVDGIRHCSGAGSSFLPLLSRPTASRSGRYVTAAISADWQLAVHRQTDDTPNSSIKASFALRVDHSIEHH